MKDDGNIFNCQMCGTRWCLACDVPFHEGQTCRGYLAEKHRMVEGRNEESEDALRRQQTREEDRQLADRCRQEEHAVQQTTRVCPSCKKKDLQGQGL